MPVIELRNVGIAFYKVKSAGPRFLGFNLGEITRFTIKREEFWALKDVSFSVGKGEKLGIIGANGAGKSTLLKLLIDVLTPDTGEIIMNGKISSLLSLGAGFLPDLSGRDNIYLNGAYLGMDKRTIDLLYDKIVAFAELEEFIHSPLRYYSSGMKTRLGFSVSTHVEPDILIVDEVLGAGDMSFRKKAEAKMNELMEKAKAIVICSHNLSFIQRFCDKALYLEKGRAKFFGNTDEAVDMYTRDCDTTGTGDGKPVSSRNKKAIIREKFLAQVARNKELREKIRLLSESRALVKKKLIENSDKMKHRQKNQIEALRGNNATIREKLLAQVARNKELREKIKSLHASRLLIREKMLKNNDTVRKRLDTQVASNKELREKIGSLNESRALVKKKLTENNDSIRLRLNTRLESIQTLRSRIKELSEANLNIQKQKQYLEKKLKEQRH